MGIKIKIEKIHDIINSFTLIIIKTKYSEYLKNKNYKFLRYLDDIDLKMFKKSEISKYKNKNKNVKGTNLIYDQFICGTDTKKIILKTKFKKFETFFGLPNFIATESTLLNDILNEMENSKKNEINVQCILSLKNSKVKIPINKKNENSLCYRAWENGMINKYGSIFKVVKISEKKIIFENLNGLPIFSIQDNINNKKNLNNDFVKNDFNDLNDSNDFDFDENLNEGHFITYETEEENYRNEFIKFMGKYSNIYINSNNNFEETYNDTDNDNDNEENNGVYSSSFLETSSSVSVSDSSSSNAKTKFYSSDLLIKIEDGMNHITEKIIDSSKKISELSK